MINPGRWGRPARRLLALVVAAAVVLSMLVIRARDEPAPGGRIAGVASLLRASVPAPRTLDAYRGQGAWVDAFDYAPAYQSGGQVPAVGPEDVDLMAAQGVHTLFLQAARNDARSPDGLVDRALLGQFLLRAHRNGMRVVAWYLPRFGDVATDLRLLADLAAFEVLGHRFDGLAVDIEYTEDVPDPVERGARLVALSESLRDEVGDDALGAIVFPPVQTEVINPSLWPAFPWRPLAEVYDAWLPMSYWTFRSEESGYNDGYRYNEESVRRLRANLGDPDVPVHAIGGIADRATAEDLTRFAQSIADTGAVGGSMYDWNTMSPASRAQLSQLFASDLLAGLAPG